MQLHPGTGCLRQVAHVAVVGQIDHLSQPAHLGKQAEGRLCAVIVEAFHDVIGNEGHRTVLLHEFMIARDAQCEVELRTRPL